MNGAKVITAIVAIIIVCMAFSANDVRADPGVPVPWTVNCEDEDPRNGFESLGYCVPGEISAATHYVRSPSRFWGLGDSYAPGVMERMCRRNGGCNGYKDGIALMSCGDIGRTAWILIPGRSWDGPFKVVDCSQPYHTYVHVVEYGLAVE